MEDPRYSAGESPCMDASQLYDADYKKMGPAGLKVKSSLLFQEEYPDFGEFNTSEISINLNNLIDDSHFGDTHFNENLIQELQSLNVDKTLSPVGLMPVNNNGLNNLGPRGLSANPIAANNHHNNLNNNSMHHPNMYNNNNNNNNMYVSTPMHNGGNISPYERPYVSEPRNIKEEPRDQTAQDYTACARVPPYPTTNPYGGLAPYAPHLTPPGPDGMKSPLKSPGCMSGKGMKKVSAPGTEEYRRRRERNNIAVRKSREKAKARSRDTEERVKLLSRDNDKLAKKCEILSKQVAVYHSVLQQYLPEQVHRDISKQFDAFQQQNQHLLNMWSEAPCDSSYTEGRGSGGHQGPSGVFAHGVPQGPIFGREETGGPPLYSQDITRGSGSSFMSGSSSMMQDSVGTPHSSLGANSSSPMSQSPPSSSLSSSSSSPNSSSSSHSSSAQGSSFNNYLHLEAHSMQPQYMSPIL